jgi:hypothetical protein
VFDIWLVHASRVRANFQLAPVQSHSRVQVIALKASFNEHESEGCANLDAQPGFRADEASLVQPGKSCTRQPSNSPRDGSTTDEEGTARLQRSSESKSRSSRHEETFFGSLPRTATAVTFRGREPTI